MIDFSDALYVYKYILIVKCYSSISSVYIVRSFYSEYVYHRVCLSQHMHDIRHAVRVHREMLAKAVLHYGKTALPFNC